MKQYCYVIVQSDGISHDLWPSWDDYNALDALEEDDEGGDDYKVWKTRKTLPQLLAAGWRPVREAPMSGGGKDTGAYALVLLEKD
jgi:hypothetical protein